jgi:hypothetical protein
MSCDACFLPYVVEGLRVRVRCARDSRERGEGEAGRRRP